MCLLPKKGDLSLLQNWRTISLTNCDPKIFTRIINSRMILAADHIINVHQTGFMRGRFIGDNGIILKSLIDYAHLDPRYNETVALLLDFMKAYDRANSEYLHAALTHYGIPPHLVQCIIDFFFQTKIRVNVNGYLTEPISQQRGLRQGDPLSPILFNLALEPLLQTTLQDPLLPGVLPYTLYRDSGIPTALKTLAYADDVLVVLTRPSEYAILQRHLHIYERASNGKLNTSKTQVLSVTGKPLGPNWLNTPSPNISDSSISSAEVKLSKKIKYFVGGGSKEWKPKDKHLIDGVNITKVFQKFRKQTIGGVGKGKDIHCLRIL
ncbi:hypothetical protein INT47_011737 [Mucor saturninus]|uniref:Reverse transcriptase domain-containing protein n=1 Tax=Mucor saturninus TaxID=64648 RepID=A0A8H7R3N8_9FUNG|nr:hypothetical protein INT47_011737 [Mucor saturninus]